MKTVYQVRKGYYRERDTIPNRNIIHKAAMMDKPAPDRDASVKSLGIFLHEKAKSSQFKSYSWVYRNFHTLANDLYSSVRSK
jgi:hypothetical protein